MNLEAVAAIHPFYLLGGLQLRNTAGHEEHPQAP